MLCSSRIDAVLVVLYRGGGQEGDGKASHPEMPGGCAATSHSTWVTISCSFFIFNLGVFFKIFLWMKHNDNFRSASQSGHRYTTLCESSAGERCLPHFLHCLNGGPSVLSH